MAEFKKYNVFGILPTTLEGLKKDLSSINKTQRTNLGSDSYNEKLSNRKKKINGLILTMKKDPSIEKYINTASIKEQVSKESDNEYDISLNFKNGANSSASFDIASSKIQNNSKKLIVGSRICSVCRGTKVVSGGCFGHSYICLHCEGTGLEDITVIERKFKNRGKIDF